MRCASSYSLSVAIGILSQKPSSKKRQQREQKGWQQPEDREYDLPYAAGEIPLTGQPCQRAPRNSRSREREQYCDCCADPKAFCTRLGRSHPLGTAADYALNPKRCCRVEFKREPIQRSDGTRREIGIPATFGALSDVSIEPVPVLQRNSFNEGPMKQKTGFFMVLKRHRRLLRERLAASTGRGESSTKRSTREHL